MSSNSDSDSEQIVADRYILRRELGRGGMGVVWEAFDPSLDRVVAIKQVLLPDHFTESERADAHGRVRREARSAARISHPTVITVHDVFEYDGDPWVVMELVEGGSLQDRLNEQGALPPDTVAEIAESLLKAVQAANAAGVLHRDIKPGNIMMSLDGRVILTDFGIATMEGGPSITRTGALIGSPEYMPPERLEGGPAEHRGDLWSIGVTLFAAVEGTSPFRRDSLTAAIAAVISAPLPPMTRAGRLEPVITGLLERDPDRRLTVEGALALLRGRGTSGGGVGPAGAAGAAGAAGVAAGAAGTGPGTAPGAGGSPYAHGFRSGGYPAAGPRAGGRSTGPGTAGHGPGTPLPQGRPRPAGPVTPQTPFPPGRRPAAPYGHSGGGGTGGRGGATAPLHSGGHGGSGRSGSGAASTARVLFGVGAGLLALLLVSVVAVAVVLRSGGAAGEAAPQEAPTQGGAPPEEPSPSAEPGGGSGEQAAAAEGDDGGEPPSYDELDTFSSQWFDVAHPAGWEVDDSEIDNSLAVFVAPGRDHQVWVTGWTEEEFTGTSAEYLRQTNGGTDADQDITTDYSELELEEFDEDDYGEGWDVAMVESDFTNESWATPERRFWSYAISVDHEGSRVFYMVSVNVPREDGDFYDDLHEEVVETFTPHL
ncbi:MULTISPECIES: serine/threonine-protein kinase [Nocardiopsidaceae]|uniref:non-specific serine/threonine protein kinase n=1 Tax=Streptomonospora nanhaiensis TaxID=1323731 RepID=A0ABY6YKA0_9ACTN|nr:serine/threonine-protein kinase [Streptomonospora nanhaiensis]WAE72749.1 protein kinase [Streptomonospora nanhaiensis]